MSFLAKLVIGSSEFVVLRTDYEISQPVDQQNKPNGKPRGGIISVTVESSNKNDLAEWMVSPTMKKSGQITFYRRDANSSMKTLAFNDGYCIGYQESFDSNSPDAMSIRLRISAGEIKINNSCTVTNPWSTAAAMMQDAAGGLGIGNLFDGVGGGATAAAFAAATSAASDGLSKANSLKEEAEAKASEAATTAQAAKQEAEAKAAEATTAAQAAKQEAEAKAAEANQQVAAAQQEAEQKADEAKETAQAAGAQVQQEAQNTAAAGQQQAAAAQQDAEQKAAETETQAKEAGAQAQQEAQNTAAAGQQQAAQQADEAKAEAEKEAEEISSFIP